MKPKVFIRSRNKAAAEGTYKAFLRAKAYANQIKMKYTKEVITFQRQDLIPRYDQTYDLANHLTDNKYSRRGWMAFFFLLSGSVSYFAAKLYFDQDLKYSFYVTYPKQMKYYDNIIHSLESKYTQVKAKLPFKGELPDITKPENFNLLKHELKNYFFDLDKKKEEEQLIQKEVKVQSQELDSALKDFNRYMEEQDKKLQKIKID